MPLNPSNTLRAIRLPNAGRQGGKTVAAGSVGSFSSINNAGSTNRRPASSSGGVGQQRAGSGVAAGSSGLSSGESHWFDKYHKLLEEHMQVKQERKEQDKRLTDITTKFRKVTRDLKLSGFNEEEAGAASDELLAPYLREISQLKERLSQVTAERDQARQDASQLRNLLGMRPSGQMTSSSVGGGGGGTRGTSIPQSAAAQQQQQQQQNMSTAGGSSMVDVSALINKQQQSSVSQNSNDVVKLRAALQDEISKNERLSQHCEHLRAQLAVASNSSTSAANTKNPVVSGGFMTPGQTPIKNVGASSNTNTLQQINRTEDVQTISRLREELVNLTSRNQQLSSTCEQLQRDKSNLEHELQMVRIRQTSGGPSPTRQHHTSNLLMQPQPSDHGIPPIHGVNSHATAATTQPHYHPHTSDINISKPTSSYAASDPFTAQTSTQQHSTSTLQQLTHDLSSQVQSLSQRLDHSQSQVQTLRGECERLLQELRQAHVDLGDTRKKTFEAEQETSKLRMKAVRADELEQESEMKTKQILDYEREMMSQVGKLQQCERDIKSSMQLEYTARINDITVQLDESERNRRSKESELSFARHDVSEAKREVESKGNEIEHLTREIQRIQKLNEELRQKEHQSKMQNTRDATDAQLIQEAAAAVMNQGQQQQSGEQQANANAASSSTSQQQGGGVFDGLNGQWNEKWELQQLREQVAQAIMDREMSEERASNFELALTRKNELVQTMMEERDQLLLENLELRRRLNGVQSSFNRPFMTTANANQQDASSTSMISQQNQSVNLSQHLSSVIVTLTGISLNGFGGLHIASLEGVQGFECGVSDPFAVLADGTPTSSNVEVPFRFSSIPLDDDTVNHLRDAFFNLQIHQVRDGNKSNLVAIGRVPAGASIASCLETGTTNSRIELLGGDGSVIGGSHFSTYVDNPALPLALLPPIDAKSSAAIRLGFTSPTTDPEILRATLLAMRTVRGIRVQVHRCGGLRDPLDSNRIPMPYVFYTATIERAQPGSRDWPLAHVITDTAVHSRSRIVSADPVFDVEPKDHIFRVFDNQVAAFFRHAVLSFVVYDVNCEQPEQNLGMVSVPLAPMLDSPASSIIESDLPLKPYGNISVTISWIR